MVETGIPGENHQTLKVIWKTLSIKVH